MAYEIIMPKMGMTMEEGAVGEWKVKEGDVVKKGDVLFVAETDKLTNDIEAERDGVILKLLVPEGEMVPVLSTIGYMGEAGEKIDDLVAEKGQPEAADASDSAVQPEVSAGSVPSVQAAPVESEPAPTADAQEIAASGKKTVLVIGGGPGGYVAAIRAAQLGAKVVLVEKEHLGGTCLNIGCIPTKAILHSAQVFEEVRDKGRELGVQAEGLKVDFGQVIRHSMDVSGRLSGGVAALLEMNAVETVMGEASFVGPGRVEVKKADGTTVEMTADGIIIAVGSVNAVPPIPGIEDNPDCIDSTKALSLEKLPDSMIVIGGGVIGLELASAYAAFGTKITVLEMLEELLPALDGDITKIGTAHLKKEGVEIHTECKVLGIEKTEAGNCVRCKDKNGNDVRFEAEKVLVATGRKAATISLNLDACGIENDRGAILVDARMRTNIPGVYAIGDCVKGYPMLAHTASAMGEAAAENIMGKEVVFDAKTNPSCVYMMPEAASVGLTEKECKAKGLAYKVGRFPLRANGKAVIANGGEGLVKIIADAKYEEVLGVHIIGPSATDLITEGALAIRLEATVDELISTIHAHPTIGEAMGEAARNVQKRAIHAGN